jgi:hypothetical protein
MATTTEQKLISSLIAALLFVLLSLPFVYELTNVLGKAIKMPFLGANGPTITGIVVHGIVYFGLILGIMYLSEMIAKKQ